MSLNEMLPSLRQLDHADKLRLVQFLVQELAREENALLKPDAAYPVWSPYESFDAAQVLLDALKAEEKAPHA